MSYLLHTFSSVISLLLSMSLWVFVLQFLFQLLRVDFRNPLVYIIAMITAPPRRFLRYFIPGVYGVELTTPLLMMLISTAMTLLPLLLADQLARWGGVLLLGLETCLYRIGWIIFLAVLARVALSWLAPHSGHPAVRLVRELSDPVMMPVQRLLPSVGGLDFSPMVVLFGMSMLNQSVLVPLHNLGIRLL